MRRLTVCAGCGKPLTVASAECLWCGRPKGFVYRAIFAVLKALRVLAGLLVARRQINDA
jgi:hypothetical protein